MKVCADIHSVQRTNNDLGDPSDSSFSATIRSKCNVKNQTHLKRLNVLHILIPQYVISATGGSPDQNSED